MAAFTSAALLAGGLLGGAVAGSLIGKKKASNQPLAPGPTNADANTATPPAPPILDPADTQAAAVQAGVKQRKRSAAGSLLNSSLPKSGTMPVTPRYASRSLLGK